MRGVTGYAVLGVVFVCLAALLAFLVWKGEAGSATAVGTAIVTGVLSAVVRSKLKGCGLSSRRRQMLP